MTVLEENIQGIVYYFAISNLLGGARVLFHWRAGGGHVWLFWLFLFAFPLSVQRKGQRKNLPGLLGPRRGARAVFW